MEQKVFEIRAEDLQELDDVKLLRCMVGIVEYLRNMGMETSADVVVELACRFEEQLKEN